MLAAFSLRRDGSWRALRRTGTPPPGRGPGLGAGSQPGGWSAAPWTPEPGAGPAGACRCGRGARAVRSGSGCRCSYASAPDPSGDGVRSGSLSGRGTPLPAGPEPPPPEEPDDEPLGSVGGPVIGTGLEGPAFLAAGAGPTSGVIAANPEVARPRAAETAEVAALAAAAGAAAQPAAPAAVALPLRKRDWIICETTEELVKAVAPWVAWRSAARCWPAVTTAASASGISRSRAIGVKAAISSRAPPASTPSNLSARPPPASPAATMSMIATMKTLAKMIAIRNSISRRHQRPAVGHTIAANASGRNSTAT